MPCLLGLTVDKDSDWVIPGFDIFILIIIIIIIIIYLPSHI